MAETKTKLQAVEIEYVCDQCGVGKMRHTGMNLQSHPPKFVHRCSHCDKSASLDFIYPRIAYEKVELPDPYMQGYMAYSSGGNNPYPIDSADYRVWNTGFETAQVERNG